MVGREAVSRGRTVDVSHSQVGHTGSVVLAPRFAVRAGQLDGVRVLLIRQVDVATVDLGLSSRGAATPGRRG